MRGAHRVVLYTRRKKELTAFPKVAAALQHLQAGTILDGELVGLDPEGRPSFNLLQNF